MAAVKVGGSVTFVDAYAVEHVALVTAVWGIPDSLPAINVVHVSEDESRTDQYGRQTVHNTSVVHESKQSAHGMFWK